MKQIKVNPNNEQFYSKEFIRGFNLGAERQYEADIADMPKWIPCSERLPEESGEYLVRPSDGVLEDYSDFSEVMIMPYDADYEMFGWETDIYDPVSLGYVDSDFHELEVVAWMPLPAPWKGDGDD